jgi:hypothetical protein
MVPLPIFIIDCQTITAVNLNTPGVKDRGLFITLKTTLLNPKQLKENYSLRVLTVITG